MQKYIADNADNFGAVVTGDFNCNVTTHLVSDSRKNTAKNILAWCCYRTVVTPEWCRKLVERGSAGERIPAEKDYLPKGKTKMDDCEEVS